MKSRVLNRTIAILIAVVMVSFAPGCGTAEPQDPCGVTDLGTLDMSPTYAVVSSDYTSSAIGLLDAEGEMITPAWLDSGTARAGIVAALSGDVSLPTVPLAPCAVVLLDRFGTDVVSRLDPCGVSPVAWQIDVGSSFTANPRDLLVIGEQTIVTRYSVNLGEPTTSLARGNDLAFLDDGGVIARIDLGAIADDGDTHARPDRMARITSPSGLERVVVGLARLSDDFMAVGPGAVAVIDLEARSTQLHLIDSLTNCGEVDPIDDAVVITCQGQSFADEATRRGEAGIVAFTLSDSGQLIEVASYLAREHPETPVPTGPTVPLAPDSWVTVAYGDLVVGVNDRLLRIEGGTAGVLFDADAFTIGDGSYDAARDLLLLPDATLGAVRRFDGEGREAEPIVTTGCHGLPPREVRRVAP